MRYILFFILLPFLLLSQTWVENMLDPNVNFYETQNTFNEFWDNKTVEKERVGNNLNDGKTLLSQECIQQVIYNHIFYLKNILN